MTGRLGALVYTSFTTCRQTLAAALLHATSLSFLAVAGQIGVQLDLLHPAVYAALVAAGLLSVLLFPLTALTLLRGEEEVPRGVVEPASVVSPNGFLVAGMAAGAHEMKVGTKR
jgi:hypothetical protein